MNRPAGFFPLFALALLMGWPVAAPAKSLWEFDALGKFLEGKILTIHYVFSPQQGADIEVKLDGLDLALQAVGK